MLECDLMTKPKQTLLERQFAHAARIVKAAIDEYPILADDTAPMFQLAVAIIREELDYKRQLRAEREAVTEASPHTFGIFGAESRPIYSPELAAKMVEQRKAEAEKNRKAFFGSDGLESLTQGEK